MMKEHKINGGGGNKIHVVENGNSAGRSIVFIHGFSQSWLAWNRQLKSELAEEFRLVAMDIRGHGLSDKPHDGYDNSKLWADDVNAVIETLNLDQPILSGWSYGPLLILDYIRHYGEDRIGGINFVGGVSKLGSDDAMSVLTPEFLSLVPGFFSTNIEESVGALVSLLRMCFTHPLSDADLYLMLGYNLWVPPYVRQGLLSRSVDNDDLLAQIKKPVLITHGADDAIVKPAAVDRHVARLAHAQVHMMANAGHAPVWDDPMAYNQRLREFGRSL